MTADEGIELELFMVASNLAMKLWADAVRVDPEAAEHPEWFVEPAVSMIADNSTADPEFVARISDRLIESLTSTMVDVES